MLRLWDPKSSATHLDPEVWLHWLPGVSLWLAFADPLRLYQMGGEGAGGAVESQAGTTATWTYRSS